MVDVAVLGEWLDPMNLEVFFNTNVSMIATPTQIPRKALQSFPLKSHSWKDLMACNSCHWGWVTYLKIPMNSHSGKKLRSRVVSQIPQRWT